MAESGPITATLERDLLGELRAQGIVVWLDPEGRYTDYVDGLVERYAHDDFFAPVVPFRGSYLDVLLGLESYGNGLDPEPLLIHLPGHTEDSVRATPLLEMYKAGGRFVVPLPELVRNACSGRVGIHEIDEFLAQGELSLTGAETWLREVMGRNDGGLVAYLEGLAPEWIVDGLLGKERFLEPKIATPSDAALALDVLYRRTGMDRAFVSFYRHGTEADTFAAVAETFAAWLMCVEYVHDLKRPPQLAELQPLLALPAPLREQCAICLHHLRERHADAYGALADLVEIQLQAELDGILPADLGHIDTFRREEICVLEGAVDALLAGDWARAGDWAVSRMERNSFWLQRDRARRLIWSLVRDAAMLGRTIQSGGRPLKGVKTHGEALAYYTERGYEVDRAHRRFEQQRLKLLDSQLPHFTQMLEVADRLRVDYRAWADALAEDFAAICAAEGFLPNADMQQRTLYDQVVHPLAQGNHKVAYFLVDAFRFEMATELMQEFQEAGTTVSLKGRLAELPSLTAVGMNVLAPVCRNGRLTLAPGSDFKGFRTGEYTVGKPAERVRAIGDRSVDNVSSGRKATRGVTLSEVCTWPLASLRKSCGDAELIVVHSKEIDDAGEANVGLATFETWLQHLKSAWNRLKGIGVTEFVFTADHGFLLQDQTTVEKPYGSRKDPSRRHVLMTEPRQEAGAITVSLSALGYDGQEGFLMFRRDTAVFATGQAGATFVHGGNSLQERVIPVLTVSHRMAPNVTIAQYVIEAEAMPEERELGYSRMRLRLQTAPGSQVPLGFVGTKPVDLALRVPGRAEILAVIKDAKGAPVVNQKLRVEIGAGWVEVVFALEGPRRERARIEVFHPDGVEQVKENGPEAYFVVGASVAGQAAPVLAPADDESWQAGFADEGVRKVFVHLDQHGSITEAELNQTLGSPRQARRFALAFDDYVSRLPFSVRIESSTSGKRYVKQS